jgi:hypothetical protein
MRRTKWVDDPLSKNSLAWNSFHRGFPQSLWTARQYRKIYYVYWLLLRTVLDMLHRNSRASIEVSVEFCCGYEKWPHQRWLIADAARE